MLVIWLMMILKSNFTTAILTTLLGVILVIILKSYKKNYITVTMSVAFICIIAILLLDSNFTYMVFSMIPENSRISNIFTDINKGIMMLVFDEFMYDRWFTIKYSLEAIYENPLLGQVFTSSSVYIGGHSYILDTMAIWGVPLTILYFWLIISPLINNLNNINFHIVVPVLIITLLLALINNIENTYAFVYIFVFYYILESYKVRR